MMLAASGDAGGSTRRSSVKTAYAAFALALSLASPSWAQAPRFDGPPPGPAGAALPPHEVLTSVRSMGLDPVSRPQLRGRVYVLRAFDTNQMLTRVVVDAWSGEVLFVRPVTNAAPPWTPYNPRYGDYQPPRPPGTITRGAPPVAEPVLDERLFPRPGRVPPGAAAPEQRSAAVAPRTPLPKVRPATPTVSGTDITGNTPRPGTTATATASPPAAALPSAAELAAAPTTPGKSIPAPVHARASALVQEAAPVSKTPTQMVPVAPLE